MTRRRRLPKNAESWPIGSNGALVITNGQTVTLTAGSLRDYSSVDIQTGGILQINGGTAVTIIGCSGNFILNGTLKSQKATTSTGGTFTRTAPDGAALSYTLPAPVGGNGGECGGIGGFGSATEFGNGGGGAGIVDATLPDASFAGYGGDGSSTAGGEGGAVYGAQGGNGNPVNDTTAGGQAAGGGGGARALSGQLLYLKIKGTLSGSGTYTAAGLVGGNGGTASQGIGASCSGGGGGGGGAGGSGGKIVVRYGTYTGSITYSVAAGTGGTAGNAGIGAAPFGLPGTNGVAGVAGDAGSTDIAAI